MEQLDLEKLLSARWQIESINKLSAPARAGTGLEMVEIGRYRESRMQMRTTSRRKRERRKR